MNTYMYLKAAYRSYGPQYDVVTIGRAPTDESALALGLEGEIVARVLDGQVAYREDGMTPEKDKARTKATEEMVAALPPHDVDPV